jgi:hypothetical protein
MTNTQLSETATIEFQYDSKYRRQVIEDQYADGWINVDVAIGDTEIYGPPGHKATGFACVIVLELLASVEAAIVDERYLIQFDSGPFWLVVEPRDVNSVNIVSCVTIKGARNPDERLDIERSHPITKQAWIREVIETAQDFHDTVIDLNPELREQDVLKQIQNEIERVDELAVKHNYR